MRILLPVVALCLFSAPVQAGSVGEFRDSIERDSDNDRRGSGPSSRDGGYDDGDDDTSEILGDLIGAILSDANRRGNGSGRLRGHRFNWGETPYQGRGFMQDRTLASTTDVSVSHRQRPGHFIGRLETLGLLNGSGVGGCGVFAKIEGARTPGVVLHHQQVVDVALGERVGLTELALQPRIVTDRAVSIFWSLSGVVYGSEDGFINGGVEIGFGATITPLRPLLVEAEFGLQTLTDWIPVMDVSAQVGLEFRPGVFAVIGYRGLGGDISPLHMATAGVQIDLGFGGDPYTFVAHAAP